MSEPEEGQYNIDHQRILSRVSQDPMGRLLVENATRQCVIEDQQAAIKKLRDALVKSTKSDSDEEEKDDGSA